MKGRRHSAVTAPLVGLAILLSQIAGDAGAKQGAERADDLVQAAAASERSGDDRSALRDYARALRWDPARTEPLSELPRLAAKLGRPATASRYAAMACESGVTDWADRTTVRRFAARAAELGEQAGAARLWGLLYELTAGKRERLRTALQAGAAWYAAGDAAEASAWFEKVSAAPGGVEFIGSLEDPTAVWEGIVASHLEAGLRAAASRAAGELAKQTGRLGRAAFWRGRVALERERPAVAYDEARACLRSGDSGPSGAAFQLLGDALSMMNQESRAVSALRSLVDSGSSGDDAFIAEARLAVVDALRAGGRYDEASLEAARLVDEWLVDTPGAPRSAWRDEQLAEAASRRVRALAEEGDDTELWALLGTLARRWGTLDPVVVALSDAVTRDPLDELAGVWLATREPASMAPADLAVAGRVALILRRFEVAGGFYRELIELATAHDASQAEDPPLALAWLTGWIYDLADSQAWAELVAALDWAQQTVPSIAGEFDSRYSRALALNALGRHDEALTVIREAGEEAKRDVYYRELEASALSESNRLDEAIGVLEEIVAGPGTAAVEAAWSLDRTRITLAHYYDRRAADGDDALADEQLETVLDLDPRHANANNDLAYRWALRGVHLDRALRMARVGVAAEPDSAAYADTLGWVLHLAGRSDEAAAELRRAVGLLDRGQTTAEDAVLYDHLAEALAATGDEAGAEAARRDAERLREPE